MDIAALSMGLSQMNAAQQASMSAMKMAMDNAQVQTIDLMDMLTNSVSNTSAKVMEQSATPHLGGSIDISL